MAESLKQCIERLSALPPKERLEAFRAIADPELRQRVGLEMPAKEHGEMIDQILQENLQRVRAKAKQRTV